MEHQQGGPAANSSGGMTEGLSAAQIEHIAEAMRSAFVSMAPAASAAAVTQPAAPVQPAAATQPAETAEAALARGRTEERARINAILNHAEAKERPIQARVLALESDLGVDQAAAMLAKMPKDAAAAQNGAAFYAAVKANGGNPQVPAGRGSDGDPAKSGMLRAGMEKMVAQHKGHS